MSPVTWGLEDTVTDRFAAAGIAPEQISCERDTYTFRLPGSSSELLARFMRYYGPTMNAVAAATANGRETDLKSELEALFREQNASTDGTTIPATFLRVTVRR